MKVPATPCPVGGLVPWMGGVWPIVSRKEHPVLGWVYVLHAQPPDGAPVMWANVAQEEIVRAMEATAQYKVHSTVELGRFKQRSILARKWNFKKGTMVYRIEGNRDNNYSLMTEAELIAAIAAAKGQAG